MITIERDEKKVKVKIQHGAFYDNKELWLYWDCDNELFAQLLTKQIDQKFDNLVQKIRQEEYERGWKDAKGHKKKADWFSPLFKLIH